MAFFKRKGEVDNGMSYSVSDHSFSTVLSKLFGTVSSSGKTVTIDSAMRVSSVWACIRLLSETIGTLPIHTYNKDSGQKDNDYYLSDLLRYQPNAYVDGVHFWESVVGNLCTQGFFVAEKKTDSRGSIIALNQLSPEGFTFNKDGGAIQYKYKDTPISKDKLFIVIGFTLDGVTPLSPITYSRDVVGLAMSADEYGGRFFKSGATPSGAIQIDKTLNPDQREKLEKKIQEKYEGSENAFRMMLLEAGMKYQQISVKNSDAQYIESRKMSVSDICRIFRVPPHMVADLERSTNNNIEHQSLDFAKYTLTPYLSRIEQAIRNQLMTPGERRKYKVKFNLDGVLRGDSESRANLYQSGLLNGWMTPNEARSFENLSPLAGGGQLMVQSQMMPINQLGKSNE